MPEFPEISTRELVSMTDKPGISIIDVRPVDAYNGWSMQGEGRGGHIKNARSLPRKWIKYLDWIEIVRNKEILPGQKLIIYGYDTAEAEAVARRFQQSGFRDISIYPYFLAEWSANAQHPMQRLENYRHLVSPRWLNNQLEERDAQKDKSIDLVVCHAHYRNRGDFEEGHIPGAIPLDTNELESTETWNRRPAEELEQTLFRHGIRKDTTVVVYGRFSYPRNDDPYPGSSSGHLGAIRCAAILLYAGVKDVRILNGGIQSWLDEGYELSYEEPKITPPREFGGKIPGRPEIFIDTPGAKEILDFPYGNLVSIRSWPEYTGEVSGYNYIEKTGRIPGSVFGNCGTDAYHMENYRNLDHTMREYHETEKLWAEMGITPGKKNAFYCGTGWRGSEAFMNAWLMGWPDIAIYDGGWFEWSNDPKNPVAKGEPEDY